MKKWWVSLEKNQNSWQKVNQIMVADLTDKKQAVLSTAQWKRGTAYEWMNMNMNRNIVLHVKLAEKKTCTFKGSLKHWGWLWPQMERNNVSKGNMWKLALWFSLRIVTFLLKILTFYIRNMSFILKILMLFYLKIPRNKKFFKIPGKSQNSNKFLIWPKSFYLLYKISNSEKTSMYVGGSDLWASSGRP